MHFFILNISMHPYLKFNYGWVKAESDYHSCTYLTKLSTVHPPTSLNNQQNRIFLHAAPYTVLRWQPEIALLVASGSSLFYKLTSTTMEQFFINYISNYKVSSSCLNIVLQKPWSKSMAHLCVLNFLTICSSFTGMIARLSFAAISSSLSGSCITPCCICHRT